MEDYEYLKESMEYREFLQEQSAYAVQMGFDGAESTMKAGFLFEEFLDEVMV